MKKNNLILAAVLVILIGLAAVYQGPLKSWQERSGQPKNFLAGIDFSKADKIEVGSDKKTTLVKQGETWRVGADSKAFPANAAAVEQMVTQLKSAQTGDLELISSSKDRKSEFQVDSSGTEVTFYTGDNQLISFIAGKMTSDYSASYISRNDDDNTYRTTNTNLQSAFMLEDWRDLVIFKSDSAKISKVRLQYPDKQYVLEKKGEDWYDGKNKLNKDKVLTIATRISSLSALKIPPQDFKPTGLDKSSLIVQVTGDGLDETLMIGKDNGKGEFYVKRGSSDSIYLVSKTDRDELAKKPDQLK